MKMKSPIAGTISGSLARIVTGGTLRGQKYLRTPGRRGIRGQSEKQIAARLLYGQAVEAWRGLSDEAKAAYNALAKPEKISGFNYYVRAYYNNLGFAHRGEITITGSAGAGPNYQILLAVGESAGSDSFDFHLSGNCSDFPNDIRFYNDTLETELDYWTEVVTGAPPNRTASIWVEVAANLDAGKTITILYGSSAESASNGYSTFISFDDFEDALQGDWVAIQGNIDYAATDQYWGGVQSMKHESTGAIPKNYINLTASDNIAIRFRWRLGTHDAVQPVHGNGTRCIYISLGEWGVGYYDGSWHWFFNATQEQWYSTEFRNFDWTGWTFDFLVDGVMEKEGADMFNSAQQTDQFLVSCDVDDATWVDNFIVRKFVSPEPVFDTFTEV